MKRAALYLRVSSEEQTVENQRPELVRLAKARGLKVVATYEENASAVKVRHAFARMMEDAHARRFDVLVIWAIDRFGRSLAGNLDDVMKLDARGVRLVSARESWLEMDGPARFAPRRRLLVGRRTGAPSPLGADDRRDGARQGEWPPHWPAARRGEPHRAPRAALPRRCDTGACRRRARGVGLEHPACASSRPTGAAVQASE